MSEEICRRAMVRSIHGEMVDARLEPMACGGTPVFDRESGCAYRCDTCFAVIGSIGQPQSCKDINNQKAKP